MKSIAMAALGATAAAAIACSAAGCSSSGSPRNATSRAPGTSVSSGPTASATESAPGGSQTGSQTGAHLPSTALSGFLVNVIKGHFVGACRATAGMKNGGTLVPANPADCAAASANPQIKATFTKLRKSLTPAGATGTTSAVKVKVHGVSATGTSVTVKPSQITVNNTSLQNILSSHPSPTSVMGFPVKKIGNRWYVVTFL